MFWTSEHSNVKAHTKDDPGYTVALVARYMDKICVVFLSLTKKVQGNLDFMFGKGPFKINVKSRK
jgi:hypothetical protein